MTATANVDRDPARLSAALTLVARRYARQIRQRPVLSIAALLTPGIGNMLVFFTPPLVVAKLLDRFNGGEQLSAAELTPYILTFAGLWFAAEIVWRMAFVPVARAEVRALAALHSGAMACLHA